MNSKGEIIKKHTNYRPIFIILKDYFQHILLYTSLENCINYSDDFNDHTKSFL